MSFEQRVDKVSSEVIDIVKRKNKDYGNSYEIMVEKYGLVALLIRFQDKLGRLDSLVLKGQEQKVSDESIEDTLKDIAGYALLELARLEKSKFNG
jgi:Nucleotide modification associated domain 1